MPWSLSVFYEEAYFDTNLPNYNLTISIRRAIIYCSDEQSRYLRRNSSSANGYPPPYRESLPTETDDDLLHVTGLRRKKLVALIVWLAVLSLLVVILFITNITLLRVLKMNVAKESVGFVFIPTSMKRLEKSSKVLGQRDRTPLLIHGSRVIINTAENDTRLVLQDGLCRLENLEQFQVISGATGKTMFSAHHPLVSIDRKIKQISARNIITNKIRSPVNEVLKLETENANLRGNEGIRMDSKAFNATAKTTLLVKTSKDGSLRLSGQKIFIGNKWKVLSLSSSPALTASVDAFRVCICMSNRPKLFVVNGNKPCKAPATICQ
uniref:Beta-sarcoglycan n=1 Tax=Ditylenchus dipsaci TaxID=166011 RepID=A0A915CYA6_9BILA